MKVDPYPLATALDRLLSDVDDALWAGKPNELTADLSPTTRELLTFWFQEDFCDLRPLNFHEGQRRAILAIIYAHETIRAPNLRKLYEALAPDALLGGGLGTDLNSPIHGHPKYACKMATGTGKTWVLNALLIWQFLNKRASPSDGRFTDNFLLVAPGLIVYDRLLDSFMGKERDGVRSFDTSDIFQAQDLFLPDTYRDAVFGFLQSSVVTKTEIGAKVTGGGLVAITNWHLLAGQEDPDFLDDSDVDAPASEIDPKVAVENVFPVTPGTTTGNALERLDRHFLRGGPLQSLIDLPDLVVFNDEAHHIHEVKKGGQVTEVEWQKSLTVIAEPKSSRFVQVDFSATPFNQIGKGKKKTRAYFPHIVSDFDLTRAMGSGLVKALALDKRKEIASLPLDFRAERDAQGRVIGLSDGQRVMLRAGLTKLQKLETSFQGFDQSKHPKLLVVCEDTGVTGFVVEFLKTAGLAADDVLAIDSNRKGEMTKAEWETTRERLFDVDRHSQPRVIVSVLMLREGFDVNNICVIVPLRSSKAQILLEQTIGRGLRLMWRGDEEIEEAKRETRERFKKKLEPNNFFDVLFVVEHPAFAEFYDELMAGGLAGEVGEDSGESATGDVESVGLKPGFEEYDFAIPFVVRGLEEELIAPTIDPLTLPPSSYDLEWLLKQIGRGDQFVSEDAQTGTQYGDYRVDSGVMTATGFNDYLSRMTRRISEALHTGITKSAKTYHEGSRFPHLQVHLPLLTSWIDAYIRERLFGVPFNPLENENWRILLLDDVAHHIAGSFATALVEAEGNAQIGDPEVLYRSLSEVETINVRASSCLEVAKAIYPRLPVPKFAGGLERVFMEWADSDTQVLAFTKIHEYKHSFLQRRYLKADGMPAMYSPDFLLRTKGNVYLIETKAQRDMTNENVIRKQRAAIAWCDQINELEPEEREGRDWHYVLLGEQSVREWKQKNARVSELLEYARLRRKVKPTQEKML
ncbi:MAG: DEAD/DEAH box helicase family protein [Solirubrobacterales bacterium]